jgi:hypothetical protein
MGREKKFTLRFILDFYDAFLRESDINKVSEALGIKSSTGQLCHWIKTNNHLKLAKGLADERRGKNNTLANYILGNLSPKAQKLWKDIEFWIESDQAINTPKQMANVSKELRQEICLQALVSCSYNISKACLIAGVNRQTFDTWFQTDPHFRELINEIHLHKKDFFENALMDLVEMRYPGAVMFVNRTINADRGYSERLDINHTHTLGTGIDINQLDLDIDTRRKILEAIRVKKQKTNGNVVDVEEVKALPAPGEVEE